MRMIDSRASEFRKIVFRPRKLALEFELEQFRGFTGTYDLLNAVHNVRCWKSSSGNNDHEQVIIKQILGWGVNKSLRVS